MKKIDLKNRSIAMLVAYHEAQHRHSRNYVESGMTPEKFDVTKPRSAVHDSNGVNAVTFFQRFVTLFEDRRHNFASREPRNAAYQSSS